MDSKNFAAREKNIWHIFSIQVRHIFSIQVLCNKRYIFAALEKNTIISISIKGLYKYIRED